MLLLLSITAAEADPLTLEDAVGLATTTSHAAIIAAGQVDEAKAAMQRARAPLLPQASVTGEYQRFPEDIAFEFQGQQLLVQGQDTLTLSVVGSQVLFAPSAFGAFGAASGAARAAEAAGEGAKQDLALGAVRAWVAARSADLYLAATQSAEKDAEDHLVVAQNALAAGTVTELAVDRAKLAVNSAKERVIEARQQRDDVFGQLALLVGRPVDELGELQPDPSPPGDVQDLTSRALAGRPEVQAATARVEAAKAGRWTVAGDWAPTVSAVAALRDTNVPLFAPNPTYYAGVQATLPVLDGGLRFAEAKRVHAQLDEALEAEASAKESAAEDVRSAVRAVQASLEALEVADQQVQVAKRAREIIEASFEAGTVTSLDVSAAQNELLDAQVGQIRAAGSLVISRWQLKRTTGTAE